MLCYHSLHSVAELDYHQNIVVMRDLLYYTPIYRPSPNKERYEIKSRCKGLKQPELLGFVPHYSPAANIVSIP